jgi:hypothetical protein
MFAAWMLLTDGECTRLKEDLDKEKKRDRN